MPLSSLTHPAVDYVALGHIHKYQDLNLGHYPPVVYSGSPDRIDFGEKDEAKGFVMIQLSRHNTTYKFVPITTSRQLIDIDLQIKSDDPTNEILEEIRRYSLKEAIVKLTYSIKAELASLVDEKRVREALHSAHTVVSVVKRVERDKISRHRLLNETTSTREALRLYLETKEPQERVVSLLNLAEPVFLAVEQLEGVG